MNDRPAVKSKVELVKEASQGLRGTIKEELEQDLSRFGPGNVHLLKFHGIYQQDDRDLRRELKGAGLEMRTIFMARTKNPGGGILSPGQWEILNQACDLYGNGTLRVTSRQDIQFHGVGKKNLRGLIRLLNSDLISTYGACGDGNRNTVACPVSEIRRGSPFGAQALARRISRRLGFNSNAYYEIWLKDPETGRDAPFISVEDEPLYGTAYLPRKFKIGVALLDDNCIDIHTHDIGVVPLLEGGRLDGFNVLVGGGMGSTYGKIATYPRLADPLCSVGPNEERLIEVLVGIVTIQRDFGGRADRKHARMKYLIDDRGLAWFRAELEQRLGGPLSDPAPLEMRHSDDHLGVHRQHDGRFYLGLFIENGRIGDRVGVLLKTGLREIVREIRPAVRLSATQDVILSDLTRGMLDQVLEALPRYGIKVESGFTPLRRLSMACPALPTCGLAITEAERYLPTLLDQLEAMGYGNERIKIRMSGCPNACSRPPVAEIGMMGRSRESYAVYVGGSHVGTRLARMIADNVPAPVLAPLIDRLIGRWQKEHRDGETFGDWSDRLGPQAFEPLALELLARPSPAEPAAAEPSPAESLEATLAVRDRA